MTYFWPGSCTLLGMDIGITDEQYEKVERHSRQTGLPVEEIIERAIEEFLKSQCKNRPR